jgi:hypothetical protein
LYDTLFALKMLTDNTQTRQNNKQLRNKRKIPRVEVYIPLYTGHNDPPRESDRDSSFMNSLLPNLHDPAFDCRPCDTTETGPSDYIQHSAVVHQMDKHGRVEKMKANYKQDRFSSKNVLEEEIIISDKEDEEIIVSDGDDLYQDKEETDDEEDEYDTCVTRRQSKRISIIQENNAVLDINNPKHYCHLCKSEHYTRGEFRFHLKSVHQIQHIPIKPRDLHTANDTTALPYFDDEDPIEQLVNSIIKKEPLSITINNNHEKKPILSQLENAQKYHPTRTNPGTVKNKPDPNFYCKSCKITKPNRSFLRHLYIIHKVTLSSTINK